MRISDWSSDVCSSDLSLQQLLEAVDAVTAEFDHANVTVIVDATFGHRIDASEREQYEQKVNSGQIITPPAGVIGRGDAFLLEVADRADAIISIGRASCRERVCQYV